MEYNNSYKELNNCENMNNRKATLEVYSVPKDAFGRKEASWVLDKKGRLLRKQNIILRLWDLEEKESQTYLKLYHFFYSREFNDVEKVGERVYEIAKKFNGTHSRNMSSYTDDASFETRQRDELKRYLDILAR